MAVNFCRSHHSPSIRCNKVSMDGFEIENLISPEYERRRKGFLAASFVTPPVEIIVTFPHSVDISHIVLGLANGSQRVSAFKLYSTYHDPREKRNFQHIGTYENINGSKLILINHHYQPIRLFQTFRHYRSTCSDIRKLSPKSEFAICQIKTLKICILKTVNNTVPVLSELQVWGQPGRDCSPEFKKMIYDIEQGEYLKSHIASMEEQTSGDEISKHVTSDDDESEIPPEFLDPITCELMSQPVLLPSGNNVDRSTLEKYVETSATWGRLPGDPFTGVSFGPLNRPTANVELKLRIDSFWLTKPNLCSGGRCVGIINPSRLRYDCENSLVHSNIKQSQLRENSLYDIQKSKDNFKSKEEDINLAFASEIAPIRKHYKSLKKIHNPIASRKQKSETLQRSHPLKRSTSFDIPLPTKALKKSADASHYSPALLDSEHLKELSVSLEFGLKQVLNDKPSFISSCEDTEKTKSRHCSICNCLHLHGAYRLPCSHTLCRSCLVRETTNAQPSCKTCNVSYLSSEVVRFYD